MGGSFPFTYSGLSPNALSSLELSNEESCDSSSIFSSDESDLSESEFEPLKSDFFSFFFSLAATAARRLVLALSKSNSLA